MKHKILAKAATLKKQADDILAGDILTPIFNKYGTINVTGSYPLDLMVWPDLDTQILLHDRTSPVKQISRMAEDFLGNNKIKNIDLIHFTEDKNPKMPRGVYMGLNLMPIEGINWKVDIWALEDKHFLANIELMQKMKSQLTPALREKLLMLKTQMMGQAVRMPKLGSYTLYQAIFNLGIMDDDALSAYLAEKGFKLYDFNESN